MNIDRDSRHGHGVTALLRAVPAPILIVAVAALAWALRRRCPSPSSSPWRCCSSSTGLLARNARDAVAGHGRDLGVHGHRCAVRHSGRHRPRLFAALRPALDLMQTLPTFVYLIPTLVLFVSAWCRG